MDFSQQIKNSRNTNVSTTFQNHRYQLPRRIAKTIIIDSIGHSLNTDINWSMIFTEPVIIDCLSDIFLDSITTYKILNNITANTSGDFGGGGHGGGGHGADHGNGQGVGHGVGHDDGHW